MNLLLFLRIPVCLHFDTNKWLWDLEGLIWNSTCLAVKMPEWNNCFSAGNHTWGDMAEEKSGIIFISLPLEMWYTHPIHPCLHQRRMKAWPQKSPFHHSNVDHLSCWVCSTTCHRLQGFSWNRGKPEFRTRVGRSNTTSHQPKCEDDSSNYFTVFT